MDVPSLKSGKEASACGSRIAGVVSCVPSQVTENAFFFDRFGEAGVGDVVKMIGVNNRRWADANMTTGDLCQAAGQKILTDLGWASESIDALLFVSQTPDFRLPATACILQHALGLSTSCIAFDINLGCSGYPYALWLGMMMIQTGAAKRILLMVGDTISKIVNLEDRATAMLFGDAGSVTAIEASPSDDCAHFIFGSDGRGAKNLIVPRGAFRNFSESHDSRFAAKDPCSIFMDGGEVFNFTLRTIPPLVARLIEISEKTVESYDAFLFHQANLFMLKHLTKKAKLPENRVPINIDAFGNTSSASIPLLMSTSLKRELSEKPLQLAMFGFGVGYSWSSASISVGPLQVIDLIEL